MNARDFEILSGSLRGRLLRTVRGLVSPDDAEDIVQETMLKLWTLRDRLDDYASPESLAVVIARRLALNLLRDRHSDRFTSLEAVADTTLSPEDEMIVSQRAGEVDAILGSLPEATATLIKLRHVEGYDNAAIAVILGCSEGAVRTALSRARKKVAELFTGAGLR